MPTRWCFCSEHDISDSVKRNVLNFLIKQSDLRSVSWVWLSLPFNTSDHRVILNQTVWTSLEIRPRRRVRWKFRNFDLKAVANFGDLRRRLKTSTFKSKSFKEEKNRFWKERREISLRQLWKSPGPQWKLSTTSRSFQNHEDKGKDAAWHFWFSLEILA